MVTGNLVIEYCEQYNKTSSEEYFAVSWSNIHF